MPALESFGDITMDTLIVWAIIALFYAPLHYLVPMLIVFLRHADDPVQRRAQLIATAIDCTFSMAIAFSLVIFLLGEEMSLVMLVLLVSLFVPYVRLLFNRRPRLATVTAEETE